jgi:hypothetical protein
MICACILGGSLDSGADEPGKKNKYLVAISQELARLDIINQCDESTKTCRWTSHSKQEKHSFEFVALYSDSTDTIYIYIDRLIPLPPNTAPSAGLSIRLLELNREMVASKFEWDHQTNSIRLSTVINTDSNLDRRALRSQIIGLLSITNKLWPELRQLGNLLSDIVEKK